MISSTEIGQETKIPGTLMSIRPTRLTKSVLSVGWSVPHGMSCILEIKSMKSLRMYSSIRSERAFQIAILQLFLTLVQTFKWPLLYYGLL